MFASLVIKNRGILFLTAEICREYGWEVFKMSRHKVMSEALKNDIAKRLGVEDIVASEGWGNVSSRNCGNIIREAIEMAERSRT